MTHITIYKDAPQQTNGSDCGIYALTKLHNWMSQVAQLPLPGRALSSSTLSFARDHIALDLASQELDSYANWVDRELRTPSPQQQSHFPPPLPHHSRPMAASSMEDPIPFRGFLTDTDTDTSNTHSDTSSHDPFTIPTPPIVRATKANGPTKNFYVLVDTLPPKRTFTTQRPKSPSTPTFNPKEYQGPMDDEEDVLMDIMTSPSRSPVLVRRLDPPTEKVPVLEIITRMGTDTPKTLPIIFKKLPGPSTSHYQGTPWENNSCWLDSGEWEALYAISLHDRAFWKWDLESAPLTYPFENRVADLKCCFAVRNLVYSYAAQKEAPSLLHKIRNGNQLCLLMPKGKAPLDSVGTQESPFVSAI